MITEAIPKFYLHAYEKHKYYKSFNLGSLSLKFDCFDLKRQISHKYQLTITHYTK
jgi:hypothetical protein